MSFSLLENPFAVLGLGTDASPAQVSARARELGGDSNSVASRALISPRTRLQAEVAFLPGLTADEVQASLAALRVGKAPEFANFAPLARANVLAHLASNGTATAANLNLLAGTVPSARGDALEVLNRGRQSAAMPPIPQQMFGTAVEQLASAHAEALSNGARALRNGADVLSGIVDSLGSSDTAKAVFLRQTMAAWERATASDANRDLERAHELDAKLRIAPDTAMVAELSTLIRRVAGRARPSRALARHFGLPHDASAEMVDTWRSLAVNLVNQHTALTQAETILDVLAREFGTSDEPGQRVARDLASCRERIASGDDLPEIKRFADALEAATKSPAAFKGDVLTKMALAGHGRTFAPAVVSELWNAFLAVVRNAPSDWPWRALREFAVRLHNEFSATESAFDLTELALQQCLGNAVTNEIRPQLEVDHRFLRKHMLQQQFSAAIQNKRRGTVRALLSQLIPLAENDAERRDYTSTLRRLQWQAAKLFVSRSFYAVVVLGIVYAIVTDKKPPSHTVTPAYQSYTPQPTPSSPSAPVAAADDGREARPPAGTDTLSRVQLRWCVFQDARLTAAKAYLENLRTSQYARPDAFNRAIAAFNLAISDFNASCGQYRYYKADKSVVDAERAAKAAVLQAEGQRLGAAGYVVQPDVPVTTTFPAAPPVGYPPPAGYTPPGYAIPGGLTYPPAQFPASGAAPPPSYSPAYLNGQQDRRAWEAWFAALGGDFQQGAEWWAGARSTPNPPPCTKAPGSDRAAAVRGCNEAKTRLASADRRRRAEPDYRAGWNNP